MIVYERAVEMSRPIASKNNQAKFKQVKKMCWVKHKAIQKLLSIPLDWNCPSSWMSQCLCICPLQCCSADLGGLCSGGFCMT